MSSRLFLYSTSLILFTISSVNHAETTTDKAAAGQLSGNIGLVSQYIYRGGVENDDLAIQGGLEYAHHSGIRVGYWGSTLDYDLTDSDGHFGFEHDFYVAYGQQLNDNWAYDLKTTAYVYHKGGTVSGEQDETRKTTAVDVTGGLNYKNLSLAMSVMLNDASFANAGDTYLSASYQYPLPHDFAINTVVGASIYNDNNDDSLLETHEHVVFSEARVGLSKTFAPTGLSANLDYIYGGENRLGEDLDEYVVLGLNYAF